MAKRAPKLFWIPAMPFLVSTGLLVAIFIHHLASYRGVCGPYAPDISAFPCHIGIYARNFFSPFAMIGLMALAMLGFGLGCVVSFVLAVWRLAAKKPSADRV